MSCPIDVVEADTSRESHLGVTRRHRHSKTPRGYGVWIPTSAIMLMFGCARNVTRDATPNGASALAAEEPRQVFRLRYIDDSTWPDFDSRVRFLFVAWSDGDYIIDATPLDDALYRPVLIKGGRAAAEKLGRLLADSKFDSLPERHLLSLPANKVWVAEGYSDKHELLVRLWDRSMNHRNADEYYSMWSTILNGLKSFAAEAAVEAPPDYRGIRVLFP